MEKKPKNGKMTLDKLALMMAKGFDHLDGKFTDRIDQLEERMDKGFNIVNQELVVVNSHLESIDETIFNLGNRQDVLEKETEKEIKKIKRRMDVVEKGVFPRPR